MNEENRFETLDPEDWEHMRRLAHRMVDDALDYGGRAATSATLGKNVGDDFRERKITLPVVLSYRRGSKEERDFWKRTLEEGNQTADDCIKIQVVLSAKLS